MCSGKHLRNLVAVRIWCTAFLGYVFVRNDLIVKVYISALWCVNGKIVYNIIIRRNFPVIKEKERFL